MALQEVPARFFFPLDQRLQLGTEGYSPRLLQKAVRQAAQAASFRAASDDLWELAEVRISPAHLQRLSTRIGHEWAAVRDQQVQAFRDGCLAGEYAQPPRVAAVLLDGGRVQTRAADDAAGAHEPGWRETKVACCQSLASQEQASDPQPEPPAKFLDPPRAARLAAEVKFPPSRSLLREGETRDE